MNITLYDSSHNPIPIKNNDLVIAIDETGQENFTDPNYPVFGLSASMCLGGEYYKEVQKPWESVKINAGLKATDNLHAAEIDVKNMDLILGLSDFFKTSTFGRIAVGCSSTTKFDIKLNPIDLCIKYLYKHIGQASDIYHPDNIFILIESSNRLNKEYEKLFMGNKLYVSNNKAGMPKREVITSIGLMDKSAVFPLLEVADFVAHAHGNEMNSELKGNLQVRKDIKAVFARTNARFKSNLHIKEVKAEKYNGKK